MCGIAGIVQLDQRIIDRSRIEAMLKCIAHRGDDEQAVHIQDRCALAHARLSIIDLADGSQPMHTTQCDRYGPLRVVYNGEIYNHHLLRTELETAGHRFTTNHSDTEVLLHGYRQWGRELPSHLRGMFALAIWDETAQSLFLARDAAGKKPLYYRQDNGQCIFASLISALHVSGSSTQTPAINRYALGRFLQLGYTLGTTLIEGIEEVPAGATITIYADGKRETNAYKQSTWVTPTDADHDLYDVIGDAVISRLEADVPLGCFISGGIDSSLIAAIAQQELTRRGGQRLRTFNVAMPDFKYDESPHAQAVARHLGTEHTTLRAQPADVFADLHHLMALTGEPTADSSLLATYWLCRAARQHVKVALSGDGGDELFAGYDRYRAMGWLRRHRWWLARLPSGLLNGIDPKAKRTRLGRLVQAARAGNDPPAQYLQMIHLFTANQIRELTGDDVPQPSAAPLPDWPSDADTVIATMRWDYHHYLRFDLLRKVDRASMAVALEVRCPLLDTQVRDFAWRQERDTLMPGGRPKVLLRQLAGRMLPAAITSRPKQGFALPIGAWFGGYLQDQLADHLVDGTLETLGLNIAPVRKIFDQHCSARADHTHRLFALLQLALWGRWLQSSGG